MGICCPNPTNTLNPTSAPHCQTSPKVLRADRFQVTPSQLASWMEQGGQDGRDLFKIGGRDGRVQIIPPHPPQQRQPKPLRITTPWLLRPSQGCPFTPCSATCVGGATSASHPARREAPPPPFYWVYDGGSKGRRWRVHSRFDSQPQGSPLHQLAYLCSRVTLEAVESALRGSGGVPVIADLSPPLL